MNIFKPSTSTKPDYKKLHTAAKSALDAAVSALQSATTAQAKVTKELDVKVEAAQVRFDQNGSAEAAHDLEIAESARNRVSQWHSDRVAKLGAEREQATAAEARALANLKAAQLLELPAQRARSLAAVSRALEGVLSAVESLPAVDLDVLQDERVREAVRAMHTEFFGPAHELGEVVEAGWARPGGTANSAVGLAGILNVSVAAMDDPLSVLYVQAHAVLGEFIKDLEGRRTGVRQIARVVEMRKEEADKQRHREAAKTRVMARLAEIERAASNVISGLGREPTLIDADRIDKVVASVASACRSASLPVPDGLEVKALLAMRGFWDDSEGRIETLIKRHLNAVQTESAA